MYVHRRWWCDLPEHVVGHVDVLTLLERPSPVGMEVALHKQEFACNFQLLLVCAFGNPEDCTRLGNGEPPKATHGPRHGD